MRTLRAKRTFQATLWALFLAAALPGAALAGDDDARTETRRRGASKAVDTQVDERESARRGDRDRQPESEGRRQQADGERKSLMDRSDAARPLHGRSHDAHRGHDDHRGYDDHRGHDAHRGRPDGHYGHGRGHHRPSHREYRGYREVWVAGHYDHREVKVWVPGYHETRVIPAVVEFRYSPRLRRQIRVIVHPERHVREWVPGYYETHTERVWVSGYWKRVARVHGHHDHDDYRVNIRLRF